MNADRIQIQEGPSRVFQNRKGESTQLMEDNRVQSALQAKMVETMQRDAMDEDDLLQGKFAASGGLTLFNNKHYVRLCGYDGGKYNDRGSNDGIYGS